MNIWQLATVLFFLTTIMYFSKAREYKDDNISLKTILSTSSERTAKDSILIRNVSERSLRYQIIAFELNSIIDKFQSSRNEKLKRKKLIDLMSEL